MTFGWPDDDDDALGCQSAGQADDDSVGSSLHSGLDDDDLAGGGEADADVDVSPGDPFFISKNAAAVLKHGILSRYIVPFASKVGSTSEGKRVVVLDGYAGPGRYADGTEGSPALLARSATSVAAFRKLECHFVEQKFKSFNALRDSSPRRAQILLTSHTEALSRSIYPPSSPEPKERHSSLTWTPSASECRSTAW